MENGDSLYARIAELEKEKAALQKAFFLLEENQEQYKQKCDNDCGCVLGVNVPIMCWQNGDESMALCSDCYWEAGYWKDDENPDNEEEIREHKRDNEDEDDEDEEKWIVICSKATFGADKKIDGTIAKNTYTFDNYSDAKQEFDNCVKAEETKERYAEIELALESENNLEQLEIWFCDNFDELEESDDEESTDEDTDDEDEEEEEEVLEDLTCAQLKQRLRAINKPVGGRKADLIQRIREHERLTAALFEED